MLTAGSSIWMTVLYGQAGAERDRSLDAGRLAEERLGETQEARDEAETVTNLLQEMLSSSDPHEIRRRDYNFRDLLDSFAASLPQRVAGHPEVEATLRATLGNAYRGLNEYAEAERHLRAVLEIRRDLFGEEHDLANRSLFDWTLLLHDKAEYA